MRSQRAVRFIASVHPTSIVAACCILLTASLSAAESQGRVGRLAQAPVNRFEQDVVAYQAAEQVKRPAKGGILFVGSSTIELWKTLARDFPRHNVINRGLGGSEIGDVTFFLDRLVFPHEPRMIFFRSGSNDLFNGRTPQQACDAFREFVGLTQKQLPNTKIVWMSLHPCPARADLWPKEKELNRLVADFVQDKPALGYVDAADITVDAKGQPDLKLFQADKQHLNAAGYKLLAARVRPLLP